MYKLPSLHFFYVSCFFKWAADYVMSPIFNCHQLSYQRFGDIPGGVPAFLCDLCKSIVVHFIDMVPPLKFCSTLQFL